MCGLQWFQVVESGEKWYKMVETIPILEEGDCMLNGEFNHSIDAKGRLIIPSKFRESLGEHFVITKGMDGCLFVYPDDEWSAFEEKLRELPLTNKKARDFKRFFLGSAVDGELDKQGRVLISSALRAYAGLAGVLDKIEIWDKKAWDAHSEEVEADIDDIASDMEDLGLSI